MLGARLRPRLQPASFWLLRSRLASSSSLSPTPEQKREIDQCFNRLDLTFQNTKEAFKSKTNSELLRGLFVLKLCSYEKLVRHNTEILKVLRKVTGKRLFKLILKSTFYGHFVAGEDQKEVEPTVYRLRQFGVKSILDYSVEADISQEEAEKKAVEVEGDKTVDASATEAKSTASAAGGDKAGASKLMEETRERYKPHKEFGDRRKDVVSARTYFYESEPECDRNADVFCSCIDAVAEATSGQGFMAVKVTALGRPALLLQLSEVIAQTQLFYKALTGSTWHNLVQSKLSEKDFMQRLQDFGIKTDSAAVQNWFKTIDFDSDGFVDIFEWGRMLNENFQVSQLFQILNLSTGQLEPLIKNLTDKEESQFKNMMQRLIRVSEYAMKKGVRVMIDAEQTYFQPAISRLTLEMMRRYNKERGNIFNTYQTYLKSALTNVQIDMHLARRENFHFGVKLVRGAYMDQERKRAAAIGYEDPINATFEDTSNMYLSVLEAILKEREVRGPGTVSVMAATHNEDAVRRAVQMMRERQIAPSERVVCFAQLYGMCDQVSFSLGQAGYSVYKYLPYGPVEEVLPYLSRRALENGGGGMLGKAHKERKLMWNEFKRRMVTGDWWHVPPTDGAAVVV